MRKRGIGWGVVVFALALPMRGQQRIAFTWDDLPAHSALPPGETRQQVIEALIRTMQAQHLPAPYGFVNAKWTEGQPELIKVLDAWRAAGFSLGNHTWSHMNLSDPKTTLEAWEAEVLRNEPVLKQEMGAGDFRWLRFPNLGEGDTPEKKLGARRFLAEHGYKIAGVTMSFGDWAYGEAYARCVASGNATGVKQLEDSYLDEAEKNLAYAHEMSMTALGREIPYVLLMHVGALDAKLLPRLLEMYRKHGVVFISLQEAVKDPFYAKDVDLLLDPAPDTLEGALAMKRLPYPKHTPVAVNFATICGGAAKP